MDKFTEVPPVPYQRIQHAAHHEGGGGHDLEVWITASNTKPEGIPSDATMDSGFLCNGVQYWVYSRRAPFTGTCPRCAK